MIRITQRNPGALDNLGHTTAWVVEDKKTGSSQYRLSALIRLNFVRHYAIVTILKPQARTAVHGDTDIFSTLTAAAPNVAAALP